MILTTASFGSPSGAFTDPVGRSERRVGCPRRHQDDARDDQNYGRHQSKQNRR